MQTNLIFTTDTEACCPREGTPYKRDEVHLQALPSLDLAQTVLQAPESGLLPPDVGSGRDSWCLVVWRQIAGSLRACIKCFHEASMTTYDSTSIVIVKKSASELCRCTMPLVKLAGRTLPFLVGALCMPQGKSRDQNGIAS